MNIRAIPITPVKADLSSAVRLAVGEIKRFLGMFYPQEVIEQSQAAQAIAGQWLSRVKGFHNDDDFWHLTRDFLGYALSGGERSRVSDQLAYYFSGFMPSYGAACAFLDMVADGRPWSDVQAFMHTMSYGNARQYVESFDWGGGQKKAQAEIDAWKDILKQQDQALQKAVSDKNGKPVVLAFAPPMPEPGVPVTDVPVRLPLPAPPAPAATPAVEAVASRGLMALLGEIGIIVLLPLTLSGDTPRPQPKPQTNPNPTQLTVPLDQPKTEAVTDNTNNDCKPQTEENKKNGIKCEEDGYVVMETALRYKRLVNPPRGRGLDGLFEKLPPPDAPNPMPQEVMQPQPGKLVFIPPDKKPPQGRYDYAAMELKKPAASIYPKFVVFEAKHISKSFDPKDTQDIEKEAKNRLGNTCDGTQLGKKWAAERIPQSLERQYPGAKNASVRDDKLAEIDDAYYARWIFVCLPGPIGSNSKLYVIIDVEASGMDLESRPPKQRKGTPSTPTTF
jgi:hypothetical protein